MFEPSALILVLSLACMLRPFQTLTSIWTLVPPITWPMMCRNFTLALHMQLLIRLLLVMVTLSPSLILVTFPFLLVPLSSSSLMFFMFLLFIKIFYLSLNLLVILMLVLPSSLGDIKFVTYNVVLFSFRAYVKMVFILSFQRYRPVPSKLFLLALHHPFSGIVVLVIPLIKFFAHLSIAPY